jgi:hypothetical protein
MDKPLIMAESGPARVKEAAAAAMSAALNGDPNDRHSADCRRNASITFCLVFAQLTATFSSDVGST